MSKKGFTLVELLAVIAILAILVIIAIPNVLKMFNDSKKNAFMVQARKTASVAQEHTVFSNDKTFDCNSLLTGQKFKDCTATVDKNNQVSVNVLGSGTYENFLMVDVTPNANSGTFVDLSKLNTIDIGEEKEFKEPLIKNNKINEPTFKIMSGKEYTDLVLRIDSSETPTEDEINAEIARYDNAVKNIKIENDTLKNTNPSKEMILLKLSFSKGKYFMPIMDEIRECVTESQIQACEKDKESDDCVNTDKYYTIEGDILTFTADKNEILYIPVIVESNKTLNNFYLEKKLTNKFNINGKENIAISLSDVLSYKDEGISYGGKTLTENDVFTYTNLKDKEGDYKYIYVVKTTQGVKIFRRYLSVVNYTSENCFRFNEENQEIEQYYYFENNVSGGEKCPMDVVIPEKISGIQVKFIGWDAFGYGCKGDVVQPTSSINNKYEIKKVTMCTSEPIGINSVVLPEGLEYIGRSAFEGNHLKTVTIPSTVTEIGWDAFADNQLQTVTFKGDKSKINIHCESFKGEKHSASVNALSELCK